MNNAAPDLPADVMEDALRAQYETEGNGAHNFDPPGGSTVNMNALLNNKERYAAMKRDRAMLDEFFQHGLDLYRESRQLGESPVNYLPKFLNETYGFTGTMGYRLWLQEAKDRKTPGIPFHRDGGRRSRMAAEQGPTPEPQLDVSHLAQVIRGLKAERDQHQARIDQINGVLGELAEMLGQ